jgi:hypothetical protein
MSCLALSERGTASPDSYAAMTACVRSRTLSRSRRARRLAAAALLTGGLLSWLRDT